MLLVLSVDTAQDLIIRPWFPRLLALFSQVEQLSTLSTLSAGLLLNHPPPKRHSSCLCAGSLEDELKVLQNKQASRRQVMAARVRLAEKRILQGTLDAVRK